MAWTLVMPVFVMDVVVPVVNVIDLRIPKILLIFE